MRRKKRGLRQAAAHIAGPCVRPAPSEPPPRAPAPTARAVRPHQPRNPHRASVSSARRARREASALWAVGPKAQSDPKRGSETMSATGREARMIEQPGARNAPPRTPRRISPGLSPAPSLRGLESRSSPKCIPNPRFLLQIFDLEKESRASAGQAARFQRAACLADMRGGFGSLASARQPYAGRRLRRREACALWALARSAKRPAGVSKYKGCARSACKAPIFARRGKRRKPGGKGRRSRTFSTCCNLFASF